MTDPVHDAHAPDSVRQKIDALNAIERQLLQAKLGKGQTPAARVIKLAQKQARLDLVAVKDSVAVAGTLVGIARQIDFQTCPLDTSALRGALLEVLDSARDADAVARYRRRDAEFQASRSRRVDGLRAFVAVARPSAALVAAARGLKLRHDELTGGFGGRAGLDELVALGRDYSCSVRIVFEGKQFNLVNNGVVDETVLELVATAFNGASEGALHVPEEAAGEASDANDAAMRVFHRPLMRRSSASLIAVSPKQGPSDEEREEEAR